MIENKSISQIKSSLLLLLASVVWGAAFVAQSIAGESVGTLTFNGIIFIIGGICLLPVLHKQRKKDLTNDQVLSAFKGGILCGIALFLASTFQQAGLALGAEAGEAGFVTAFYIILVPILGIFIHRKCPKLVWLCVGIALTGLYFLCIPSGSAIKQISLADMMLLLCAFLFSVQILGVDHYAPRINPVLLTCTQFFTAGAISLVSALFFELLKDPAGWLSSLSSLNAWIPILYTGVFSSAVGYTLQAVGQRNLNPTLASLIMSMESVFSTLFGWIILGQVFSQREALGCILIFSAIILSQLSPVFSSRLRKK